MNVPCILDHEKIRAWKEYGLNHEISLEEYREILKGNRPIVGYREGHVIHLQVGFRFVFSIENCPTTNPNMSARVRRLSGSCGIIFSSPFLQSKQKSPIHIFMT